MYKSKPQFVGFFPSAENAESYLVSNGSDGTEEGRLEVYRRLLDTTSGGGYQSIAVEKMANSDSEDTLIFPKESYSFSNWLKEKSPAFTVQATPRDI